jgi:GT2 family glycosyltransferase
VVIPTHDRARSLARALDALGRQAVPPDTFDVIVVADRCTDDTAASVRCGRHPFPSMVLGIDAGCAGAARNRGAAAASGELLIFLDDDVEAGPGLIEAHWEAHRRQAGRTAIGYLRPSVQGRADFFATALRGWWESMVDRLRQPAPRFRYTDLLSGNFSVDRALFARVGGFDERFGCHEDYEIGYRLIAAHADFTFEPSAAGVHHDGTDIAGALRRKYDEGRADVALGRHHPELRRVLFMARALQSPIGLEHHFRRLAFVPSTGDRVAAIGVRTLAALEAARLRGRWHRLLFALLGYWYWRGVQHELGSRRAVRAFLDGAPPPEAPSLDLDLALGIAHGEALLDRVRPRAARLLVDGRLVGRIPDEPGAERLRGCHLRRALAWDLARPLREALLGEPSPPDCDPRGAGRAAGSRRPTRPPDAVSPDRARRDLDLLRALPRLIPVGRRQDAGAT